MGILYYYPVDCDNIDMIYLNDNICPAHLDRAQGHSHPIFSIHAVSYPCYKERGTRILSLSSTTYPSAAWSDVSM